MKDPIEMRHGVSNIGCIHLTLSQHRRAEREVTDDKKKVEARCHRDRIRSIMVDQEYSLATVGRMWQRE
jgi:hypothetical protein